MYRVFIHRSTESLGQYTGKIAGKGAFLKTDFCLNLWLNWRWSEQISKKIFKNSTLFRERQITQAMARAISRTLKFIGTLSKILKKNSFDLKYPKLVLADKGKFPFASAKNEQNAQLPESLSTAICGFIRQCSWQLWARAASWQICSLCGHCIVYKAMGWAQRAMISDRSVVGSQ